MARAPPPIWLRCERSMRTRTTSSYFLNSQDPDSQERLRDVQLAVANISFDSTGTRMSARHGGPCLGDLLQKGERSGSVSAGKSGAKITRGSHREPLGGCGDGKLGNPGRS